MSHESVIAVQDLVVEYESERGPVRAVDHVNLEIGAGEFFTLLGPSGCGKTTTLRAVAGLETPTSGTITLDGEVVFSDADGINVASNKRRLGMVFQSYAVWPHMSVLNNVSYPLRSGRNRIRNRKEVRARAMGALERVQLSALADRNSTELSGGQQQRVALARALVTDPKVLLLDEPLSNLDAALRADMRVEMEELVRSIGTTALYVTHDQVEALAMSDQVAVMRAGKTVQVGPPRDIYDRPRSLFAAGFLGSVNTVVGRVVEALGDGGHAVVEMEDGARVTAVSSNGSLSDKDAVRLGVRPEHVSIAIEETPARGLIKGVMRKSSFIGDQVLALIQVGDVEWRVRLRPTDPVPAPGEILWLRVPDGQFIAFAQEQ